MGLYLLKIFSRNILKMMGIFIVFVLISLLIISPSVISSIERERQVRERFEELRSHLILRYIVNVENSTLPEVVDSITQILDGVEYIDEYIFGVSIGGLGLKGDNRFGLNVIAFYPDDSIERFLYIELLDGDFDVDTGKILLNIDYLVEAHDDEDLSVGSEITLRGLDGELYTFNITGLFTFMPEADIPMDIDLPEYNLDAIISSDDLERLANVTHDMIVLNIYMRLDPRVIRGELQSYSEVSLSIMRSIERSIGEKYIVTAAQGFYVASNVFILQTLNDIVSVTVTSFYSFPYIFGIWFLIAINIEIVIRSFRRDLGLIQLRGVSNKAVRRYFLLYMFIIATAGLSIGILISPFIGNLIVNYLGYEPLPIMSFYSLESSIISFVLGYILLIIAFHRRVWILKNISPISIARKYFEPFERSDWRPSTLFYIFFILAVIKMVEWGLAINISDYIGEFGPISIILIIYSIVSNFMNILAPIIVIYGVVNLTIYKTEAISKITKIFSHIFARGFSNIVYRYSGRLPGLISKTTFLSGLLISLMIYYIIFSGRTIYFLDSVSNVEERVGSPVYIVVSGTSIGEFDRLKNIISDILDRENIENYFLGYVLNGGVGVFNTFEVVRYLYVDDIDEFLEYAGIDDWMVTSRVEEPNILMYRVLAERLSNSIGSEIIDSELEFDFYTHELSNPVYIHKGFLDGYIAVLPGGYGLVMDRDFISFEDLNVSVDSWLVIFSSESSTVSYILKSRMGDLREYGVESVTMVKESTPINPLASFMSILQKNLYSFNVYSIVAVAVAITLLSIEYIMDMVRDLISMRARGLSAAATRFVYILLSPITLFSIAIGFSIGIIAGFGASQQIISIMLGYGPSIPIFIDVVAPIYLGVVLLISILIPYIVLNMVYMRYVREVVHFG